MMRQWATKILQPGDAMRVLTDHSFRPAFRSSADELTTVTVSLLFTEYLRRRNGDALKLFADVFREVGRGSNIHSAFTHVFGFSFEAARNEFVAQLRNSAGEDRVKGSILDDMLPTGDPFWLNRLGGR